MTTLKPVFCSIAPQTPKSGAKGGGSEQCLNNRLRSNRRNPSDGKNVPSEPSIWRGDKFRCGNGRRSVRCA